MNDSGHMFCSIDIPFPSLREAEIAFDVLRVDAEPPRSQVTKVLTLEKSTLRAEFSSPTTRQLRVAVDSFLDKVALVGETLEAFGPPTSDKYSFS